MRLLEIYDGIIESKATETQAMKILNVAGVQNGTEILNDLLKIDDSKNQRNLAALAYFYLGKQDLTALHDVFSKYEDMVTKKRIKPYQFSKKGFMYDNKMFKATEFDDFNKLILQSSNDYATDDTPKETVEVEYDPAGDLVWSGNDIDIYDGHDVGKCIKYTMGSLPHGGTYEFCIGQPGNTMWKTYRDDTTSTFYFIVDRNKFKTRLDGSPNLDDPLHIVVFDARHDDDIGLTDANNDTGYISEFGDDVQGYVNYLESMGVPVDELINKPKTDIENEEDRLYGSPNYGEEWFKNLPIEEKSKYIGRGHSLNDDQFAVLIGKN